VFGATVELPTDSEEPVTYQIVGDLEADIKQGLISVILADRARADRQERGRYRRGERFVWQPWHRLRFWRGEPA
jgi:transcription elongation GreA/GreB family factor